MHSIALESHCGASDMGNYDYALGAPGKRAALYVRVSTDKQTVENQVAKLTEVAKGRGSEIVATFNDAGISGAKERKDRPGLDQMLKDASKGRFDEALPGRSAGDCAASENCGVDLFIDRQFIDTTTPTGKLMFQSWCLCRV